MKRLMHIYTGDGKGKTTAALGLGMRAWGRGWRVVVIQFVKGRFSGEMKAAEALGERYRIIRGTQLDKFTWSMNEEEKAEMATSCQSLLQEGQRLMREGACDLLVMDEMLGAMHGGFLTLDELLDFAGDKPENVELVMTGRRAPEALMALADYVSEIQPVKHPMNQGIAAREGIED